MKCKFFLDTNVLIYLFDKTDVSKRLRAEHLIQSGVREGTGHISYQVVQEAVSVIIKKLHATTAQAHQFLEDALIPLWLVNPTGRLYRNGLDIVRRYKFSFYDRLIVAAALDDRCEILYGEDLQDGQRIERFAIVNPFDST